MNKYNVHGLLLNYIKRDNCLHLWHSLSNKWDEIKDGAIWSIIDGCLVNFWNDHWVEGVGPLKLYQKIGDQIDETLRVYNVATINSYWNWNWLETILPQTILDHIATIMPPSHDSGTDRLTWRWMLKGKFSLAGTYKHFLNRKELAQWDNSSIVWKISAPQRVRTFIWLLLWNSILTSEIRGKRRMADDVSCQKFGAPVEIGFHEIRIVHMQLASGKFWYHEGLGNSFFLFASSLENWLKSNLLNIYGFLDVNGEWSTLFSITSWLIWKHRNDLLFKEIKYSSIDLIATSTTWTRNTVNTTRMNNICSRDYTKGFWQPPPIGWVKINIDASFTAQSSSVVVGGVFRDHEGEWLLRFDMNIGRSSVYQTKSRAFYEGMFMAWNEGFRKLKWKATMLF